MGGPSSSSKSHTKRKSDSGKHSYQGEPLLTKADRKRARKERALSRPGGPEVEKAKQLWVKILQKEKQSNPNSDSQSEKKQNSKDKANLAHEIFKLLGGRLHMFAFRHDASRIIQATFKHSSPEIRSAMVTELMQSKTKDDNNTTHVKKENLISKMANDKYARCIVHCILRESSKSQKALLIDYFKNDPSHVISVGTNSYGNQTIEMLYTNICNRKNAFELLTAFFGQQFNLLAKKKVLPLLYKQHQNQKGNFIQFFFFNILFLINLK